MQNLTCGDEIRCCFIMFIKVTKFMEYDIIVVVAK